jgi:hypothetical protein
VAIGSAKRGSDSKVGGEKLGSKFMVPPTKAISIPN